MLAVCALLAGILSFRFAAAWDACGKCKMPTCDPGLDGDCPLLLLLLVSGVTRTCRAMNVVSEKRPTLSIFQKIENMNLALNAARGIGCVVTNVNAKVRISYLAHVRTHAHTRVCPAGIY